MIVYIASPYSNYANKLDAVSAQVDTFAILRDLGYQPIAPLLSHYVDVRHPASYDRWLEWCMAMIGVCDVVLRLPGASVGADREVAKAKALGKPVVHSVDELLALGTITRADHHAANAQALDDIAAFVDGELEIHY